LLELSGIRNREVLPAARVECKVELPAVGNNLQKHLCSTLVYELIDNETSLTSLLLKSETFTEHQQLLVDKHDGALSEAASLLGLLPYQTCVTTSELDQTLSRATMPATCKLVSANKPTQQQQHLIAAQLGRHNSTSIGFVVFPRHFDAMAYKGLSKITPRAPPGRHACFTVIVSAMHPLSRSSVHITSSNPHVHPNINLGLLTHSVEANVIAAGLAFVDQALQSEHVRSRIKSRFSPPPEVELQDQERAKGFVKEGVIQYHHPIGTCAIGRVVDERLRVKGVEGLRIVNTSVFPMYLSAAIVATVYAIAEKAADIIKQQYNIAASGNTAV
jgi:choline dehydrogenase-like flavoprotein